ncbi:MAG TPA: tetratricopeptide repeat protein [Phycisphaerales bacterium]|nr:tetratricopeptide repeat protein [Phycisphaerales bacterium]
MNKPAKSLPIIIPGLTVFCSSACIMILEIVAGRLIARFLGSSLYTWTSIIGVVLAGITVGNYLGGRIADKYMPRKTLSVLFALASASCILIVLMNNTVGEWMWLWKLSWPVRIFTHVAIVFLLPSTILGTISPVVAKMALDQGYSTGRTVGDIYAWGAAGSIAGTFMAGFWLIAMMGTTAVIWTVGGILLVMAAVYWVRLWPLHIYTAVFLAALLLSMGPMPWCQAAGAAVRLRQPHDPSIIYEDETAYCYVAVHQLSQEPDRRAFMQDKLKHSGIVMGDLDNLEYFYTHIYAAVSHAVARDKQQMAAMVIGGGGYVYPRYLQKHFPNARIDVVEIDPGVTKAAVEAFGLPADSPINTITMDARNYVDELLYHRRRGRETVKYDLIFEDAINDYSVPFQLVTKEFNESISQILSEDGVYLVNLIDYFDSGLFLGSVIATIQETFPYVSVATEADSPTAVRNTFVVIASQRPLDLAAMIADYRPEMEVWRLTEHEIEALKVQARCFVLTDDHAPVENMLAPVVLKSASEFAGLKYFRQAKQLADEGHYNRSLAYYNRAVLAYPHLGVRVYNEMGIVHEALNEHEKAIDAFKKAIEVDAIPSERGNVALASIYFNIGVVYQRLNRSTEATQYFNKAIEDFRKDIEKQPDLVDLWTRLGDALASLGNFAEAEQAFRQAVRLAPMSPSHRFNLARTLEFQGLIDDALRIVQDSARHFAAIPGASQAVSQFNAYAQHLLQKKAAAPQQN